MILAIVRCDFTAERRAPFLFRRQRRIASTHPSSTEAAGDGVEIHAGTSRSI